MQPAPAPADLVIVDATAPFWTFWSATAGKPEPERVRMFQEIVVAAHPQLFDAGVLGDAGVTGKQGGDHAAAVLSAYLRDVIPFIPRMQVISAQIRDHFHDYAADFKNTFPDFAPTSAVYFTVSLFSFDGATREVDGRTALLFGIDGIARFHDAQEDLKVLFQHELFHQYHAQILPASADDDAPLWNSLWEEGLATYVSQRMNPGSSEAQVLLSPTLAAAARPLLPALAREMLANLDSKDRDEYAAFFYVRNRRTDIPGRSGYFLGYRVAQELAAGKALTQVARWNGPELETSIRRVLERMAAQP